MLPEMTADVEQRLCRYVVPAYGLHYRKIRLGAGTLAYRMPVW
jgi:hypothetical protein